MKIYDILARGHIDDLLSESVSPDQVLTKLGQDGVITYTKEESLAGGKKNEMQGRVTKTTSNLQVHFTKPGEYEQRMRDAGNQEFVAQASKWGTYREDGLIERNGDLYVQVIVIGAGKAQYFLDGKPIDKNEVIGLKPSAPRDPNNPVVIRLKLKTITSVA